MSQLTLVKLEYILIFEQTGIPIYSRCFGSFCASMSFDPTLLSGFLSALSTMPSLIGHEEDKLQSVDMGSTKLNFSQTTPSGHIISIGIIKSTVDKNTDMEVNKLFSAINQFLEENYKDVNWSILDQEERDEFEKKMITDIIPNNVKTFHNHDICNEGECPLDTKNVLTSDKKTIWEKLNYLYTSHHPNRIKQFIRGKLTKLWIWFDMRQFHKKEKANTRISS